MEQYISLDQSSLSLWTKREGGGIPILLCSGGPGCCDYLEPVADMLSDLAQVIRFDQRGCGRSNYTDACQLQTCLTDIEEIRKYYQIEKWIIVGHSWGADLALAYTLYYPESVYGLVYMSGTGVQNDRDWKATYQKGIAENKEQMVMLDYPVNKEVHRSLIDSWRAFIKEPELLRRISEIKAPSYFLYGDEDIRPSWPIQQIAHLIKDAQLHCIKGAGHYIWLQKPDSLQELLKGFVKQIALQQNF
ncbi:alpha/beta fold hydrolase [Brevibacillus laterosporus]|uniref:Alpha/beta hydrolase n=1 Tax=Brevibacillus laterosporus TaxID=1465 RepID=A0AAP3G8I0_BRELA|nr:alpha/beta hydrolase [Brevibacillus laterosporus]MCR8981424.1 alpha/beta hydrolase [Brevibacillus laterosporus]MCZ0808578.1 alpha/beta hydrolase [Brevibacillus laterosporus]MCZ0826935.1 alpha/beta hydrolase [Brevibacillus laterosporus]MCZ0850749.1 alpha/beta hydrolase [Brevibacillus laterosporus]MED1665078.1 alpha/beta hydrolase [Brevibacillus laterosporus]